MTGSTSVKLLTLGLLAITAAACSPIVRTHGNLVEPDRLALIHEGTTRKAEVADILGTPTATGTFDPGVWYYISQRTESEAFYRPEVTDRKVVLVRFDERGVVSKVDQLDLTAGEEVEIVARSTPTAGKDLTFLEQMLGNVGRFSTPKKQGPGAPGL